MNRLPLLILSLLLLLCGCGDLEASPSVSPASSLLAEVEPADRSEPSPLSPAVRPERDIPIPPELLELAEKNPEAADYVANYPVLFDRRPAIDLSKEAAMDHVPLLLQWDARWGYAPYGAGLMGYTGCGPTCLSMVALYLTHDPRITPLAVAEYAQEAGYAVAGQGTAWSLMSKGCEHFGLKAKEIPLVETRMKRALDSGSPILCVVGAGDFTDNGHFLVLTGWDGQGFTLNDPNSPKRSSQHWSFERLSGQIRGMWAMELR